MTWQWPILIKRLLVTFGERIVRKFTKLDTAFDVEDDEAAAGWQGTRFRLAELMKNLVDGVLVLFAILGLFFVAWWLVWFGGKAFSNP